MSLKELKNLQRLRQREIELLQSRVMTLGEALENGPRQWVEKHPYVATGTAAAFTTAYGAAPTYSIADATMLQTVINGTPSLTDGKGE